MNTNFSVSRLMNPSWSVDTLKVKINGVELVTGTIFDYTIDWKGPVVEGYIDFMDFKNISDKILFGPRKTNGLWGTVEISYYSQEITKKGKPIKFQQTFVITDCNNLLLNYEKGVPSIRIHFTHTFTEALSKTYINTAIKDKSAPLVFKEILTQAKLVDNVKIIHAQDNDIIEHIITPSHVSLDYVLANLMEELGYSLIIDKQSIFIIQDKCLSPEYSNDFGEYYKWGPPREYAHIRNQIIEFNINGFNGWAVDNGAPAGVSKISEDYTNPNGTSMEAKVSARDYTNKVTEKSTLKDLAVVNNVGDRLSPFYRKGHADSSLDYAETAEIWIPGRNGNFIGQTITAEIPKTKSEMQDSNSKAYTGKWIVYAVKDKIISNYFIQKLSLRRPGKI